MTSLAPKSVIERAVLQAKDEREELIRRVVEGLQDSGGFGFQASVTKQEELDYYRSQFFRDGQLDPAGIEATLARVGKRGFARIVKAMGEDFKANGPFVGRGGDLAD